MRCADGYLRNLEQCRVASRSEFSSNVPIGHHIISCHRCQVCEFCVKRLGGRHGLSLESTFKLPAYRKKYYGPDREIAFEVPLQALAKPEAPANPLRDNNPQQGFGALMKGGWFKHKAGPSGAEASSEDIAGSVSAPPVTTAAKSDTKVGGFNSWMASRKPGTSDELQPLIDKGKDKTVDYSAPETKVCELPSNKTCLHRAFL